MLKVAVVPDGPNMAPAFVYQRQPSTVQERATPATLSASSNLTSALLTGNDKVGPVLRRVTIYCPELSCAHCEVMRGGQAFSPVQTLWLLLMRFAPLGLPQVERVLDPRWLPMVVPPLPWSHHRSGGLLLRGPPVVRGYDRRQRHMLDEAHDRGDLDNLYQALDVLSRTTWWVFVCVLDGVEEEEGW